MNKIKLTHIRAMELARALSYGIHQYAANINLDDSKRLKAYAVPRGGVPVAYMVGSIPNNCIELVDTPEAADIFIDDLIDSGATLERYCDAYPDKPFFALIDKRDPSTSFFRKWVVFPWEVDDQNNNHSMTDNIVRLLENIGENPNRGGLRETPARVVKAWQQWTSGYTKNAADILKVFEDGAEACDNMVVVRNIPIYSHCEHHLAAIIGTCDIAYIPDGKIVGLSKLSRLADMFARRLQVQERMTNQIADALMEHLDPIGVGVRIKARHLCMESRGVCQQGHHTVTTALRGQIKEDSQARSEFLNQVD